jgi:type VI secretion system secreted protein VgrG
MSDVVGYTQGGYAYEVTTPFGPDTLLLQSFDIDETVSQPFDMRLVMLSEYDDLDFSEIVGQGVTLTSTDEQGQKCYFHGIVCRFRQDGRFYIAEVHPRFWQLQLASDNRIFQNKTTPDIVTGLLNENGVTDIRNALTGTYNPREYCVQYQETTFNFVSRLLEEEGIFYFFEHYEDKHVFVLADHPPDCPACVNVSTVQFKPQVARVWSEADRVIAAGLDQAVVANKFQATDYDFTASSSSLQSKADDSAGSYMLYEYPGLYLKKNDGEARVKMRLDEAQSLAKTLWGRSICRTFRTGHKFTLTEHPQDSLNADYVLHSITHRGEHNEYENSFHGFPATAAFRPRRSAVKPRIHGTQTAVVVGKSGEEIWTDQYGRIKVQFHWDLLGTNDENSSCWIRVAQGWAGKNWGATWLPRIGQEVVVAFLDGDPDRPLIVGSVYNSQQPVPYTLPDEQTKSTIKSNSSKGGNGFNEIRLEDKANSEEIYLHAQKDMKVDVTNDLTWTIDHNETATVKNDRSATITEGNESLTVSKGNHTVTISQGNDTLTVSQGTRTVSVTGSETHTSKNGFTHEITGDFTLKVNGSITIQATGGITIKAGTSLELDAGTSLTLKAGTSLTGNAGTSLSLAGAVSAELKGNASANVQGSGMLTLKGGIVQIN